VACEPDETLVTAYCISRAGARLTDNLVLDKGLLRAKCSATVSSILVACTPTIN
jgi:hypothetical protein